MKKIFESELNSIGGISAEKVYVFALDNQDEYWKLAAMDFQERCSVFDVQDEYNVAPGARYCRYDFDLYDDHIIMVETVAYNV